jgi:hypothetical protein
MPLLNSLFEVGGSHYQTRANGPQVDLICGHPFAEFADRCLIPVRRRQYNARCGVGGSKQTSNLFMGKQLQAAKEKGETAMSDIVDKKGGRIRFWGVVGLSTFSLGLLEVLLFVDLSRLERGDVESIREWAPIKTTYEYLGSTGALSVLPALWVFIVCASAYGLWERHHPARAKAISQSAFQIQRVMVILMCSLFGGTLILGGIALALFLANDGAPPMLACGIVSVTVLIGGLFIALAWHNRRAR